MTSALARRRSRDGAERSSAQPDSPNHGGRYSLGVSHKETRFNKPNEPVFFKKKYERYSRCYTSEKSRLWRQEHKTV